MNSRRQFIGLLLLTALPLAAEAPAKKDAREFAFRLARFNYLFLTTDDKGYRLFLVQDSKEYEIMRTSFSDFQMKLNEVEHVLYEWKLEGEDESIALDLRREKEPGERYNRSINYGYWKMNVTGKGTRFEQLKAMLLQHRVNVYWDAEDSLDFRGSTAAEDWKDAYLHR